MNVRFVFFKAIALCAIMILSSCQSQEEKVISRLNDLTELIKNEGKDWSVQDWEDAMGEYAQICEDATKCNFSIEQYQQFSKACVKMTVAVTSNGATEFAEAMEAFSSEFAKGMEAYSKELAKGMEALSDELVDDEEDFDDEEYLDDEEEYEALPKVYSNCYDGYLNVRSEPSSKSQILGTLPNGPEGAELLGVEGKWTKVRVNGVVGYIWSADVQSTPTEPVFISASDVVGEWAFRTEYSGDAIYRVKSNGKFEFYDPDIEETSQGTWYLSRYSIVFKYIDGDGVITATVSGREMDFGYGAVYRKR